jgi:hypothetical protein
MLYVTGFHALRNSKSVPIEQTYQVISRQQSNRQLRPSQSQSTMKSSVQPPVNQTVNFSSKSSRVESFTDRTSVRVHNSHGDDGQGSLPKPTTRPLRKFQSSKRWQPLFRNSTSTWSTANKFAFKTFSEKSFI